MNEQEIEKEIDECFKELVALVNEIPETPVNELEDHLEKVDSYLLATQGDILRFICDELAVGVVSEGTTE